jgi:hypothetical protein
MTQGSTQRRPSIVGTNLSHAGRSPDLDPHEERPAFRRVVVCRHVLHEALHLGAV